MLDTCFSTSELAAIGRGLARGDYNLLLGAGASMGGLGGDGRPLPLASGLVEDLVSEFKLPAVAADTSLQSAYAAAGRRLHHSGLSRSAYLQGRFTGCTPPSWHERLPRLLWRRIWSLNIDDTIEVAYDANGGRRQRLAPHNWIDRHTDDASAVQLVHLHGVATAPDQLVFSVVEYVRATASPYVWHRIFGDHFAEQPFIVIGARLEDEVDLAAILDRGSGSLGAVGLPSIAVLRSVSPLTREHLEAAGLIVIDASADAFIDSLAAVAAAGERALAGTVGVGGDVLSVEARTFLTQFRSLRLDSPPPLTVRDFYAGFEASWHDIQSDRDAVLDPSIEVARDLAPLAAGESGQHLEIIYGPMGTGKSTSLLRIARLLIAEGCAPFLFQGDTLLDVDATLWWLTHSPRTVLVFDGLADQAVPVAALLDAAAAQAVPTLIIATERERRMRTIYGTIAPGYVGRGGGRLMRFLSDRDIYRLVDKLRSRARLGVITQLTPSKQREFFSDTAGRQLWAGMAHLEKGGGFLNRLDSEFASIEARWSNLIGCAALTYSFGYPLPFGVACVVSGLEPRMVATVLRDGGLGEWIWQGRHGIVFRNRLVASMLIERTLDSECRYRLSLALAKALAPLVDISAIRSRTIPYRIVRNLLDADAVGDLVGPARLEWYTELEPLYGWNARYWEQRALALVATGDLAAARSYAERAITILRDPFTLTTLAGVVLRQVARDASTDRPWEEQYWAGVELLTEAKDAARVYGDHAQSVFFHQTLAICEALPLSAPIPATVVDTMARWMTAYEKSAAAGYVATSTWLAKIRERWLEVCVRHDAPSTHRFV